MIYEYLILNPISICNIILIFEYCVAYSEKSKAVKWIGMPSGNLQPIRTNDNDVFFVWQFSNKNKVT